MAEWVGSTDIQQKHTSWGLENLAFALILPLMPDGTCSKSSSFLGHHLPYLSKREMVLAPQYPKIRKDSWAVSPPGTMASPTLRTSLALPSYLSRDALPLSRAHRDLRCSSRQHFPMGLRELCSQQSPTPETRSPESGQAQLIRAGVKKPSLRSQKWILIPALALSAVGPEASPCTRLSLSFPI